MNGITRIQPKTTVSGSLQVNSVRFCEAVFILEALSARAFLYYMSSH